MEQGIFCRSEKIIFSTARSVPFSGMPGPPSASPPPTGSWNRFSEKYRRSFPQEEYSLLHLSAKYTAFSKPDMKPEEKLSALIKAAVELTTQEAPRWEFIAARLLNYQSRQAIDARMEEARITCFYEKLRYLTDQGLYGSYILEQYSREEIEEAALFLDDSRDELFTYAGLDLLLKRYCIRTKHHILLETPQEMFLGIALHLAMKEKQNRLIWVRKFYDCLSRMEVTMATPTLSNARKPYHQLSSCFIDTVPDSLDGIYRSVDNFAQVSKFGGGMGLYFGKVRATGSSIRGFKGGCRRVIRWIKLVNDTAVAVDQLGMRQGAAAVYLDAWHKDLPEFLQLRTNNGDDRMKAHDIFPGCVTRTCSGGLQRKTWTRTGILCVPTKCRQSRGMPWRMPWGKNGRKDTWTVWRITEFISVLSPSRILSG